MSMTMRVFLIKGLAKHMKTMTAVQACTLADELTTLVSAYIRRVHQGGRVAVSPLERLPSFPKETWNELTIGVPWEAYCHAHGVYGGKFVTTSSTQALCSAPAQLDVILAEQAMNSGLWGGSLLVALGKILEGVEKDLVVFSPYWRAGGVQSLMAAAGRQSYAGVTVTVFSQPKVWMKADDENGLALFIEILKAAGALVQVLAPRAKDGLTPILHAKLIIADGEMAYVGSANFTKSGLDHGLEAGVLVEGEIANAFSGWSKAIAATCEPW
ncbi:phospholipase D-like domain-containing protein [Achromobacter anxifer]|nr:phospholipase D-like domain-containing protein [Achromobacter anxifer]